MSSYMVPGDLWVHAMPPSLLFGSADTGAQGLDQGSITAPVRISGTGTGTITAGGIPRDAWIVHIQCAVGGEINDPSTLNPDIAQLPSFRLSNDGGITYSAPLTVSTHRDRAIIEWPKFGMKFYFENGSAAPSYVPGDTWECITQPSADIVAGIPVVSSYMDSFLVGSFDLPLSSYPPIFTASAADLLRWRLIKKVGLADGQDFKVYQPTEVMEWLRAAQRGDFIKPGTSLGIVEKPSGTSVQQMVRKRDLLRGELPI